MLTEFRFTEECAAAFRTSLTEVKERVVEDKNKQLQRTHRQTIEWKDSERGTDLRATIRTCVTNPVGTDKIKVTISIDLPGASLQEQSTDRRHNLSETAFCDVEEDITAILEDVFGDAASYGSPSVRLRSAGTSRDEVSYYGESEVQY